MQSETREDRWSDLYTAAVAAACRVLNIPEDEAGDWQFVPRNLWRQRPDGLWEWAGKGCPPTPTDYEFKPVRDEERNSWVMVPRAD